VTALALVPPPTVPAPVYWNATVLDVHDGDTMHVRVDRGNDDTSEWSIRVRGAACRELADPGGFEARGATLARACIGATVVLAGLGDDKYGGRHLATVYVDRGAEVVDLADWLIEDGWASAWDGTGPQPKPAWPRVARPRSAEQPLAA
jgi:endonuclease YncB( thermonuclease family)